MSNLTGSILVVDDNRMNRLMLARGLEQQGHQVWFAENGRQALEMMQNQAPDLVLLDIEMPEMNGYEVLEQLNANPHWRDIPVIMISAVDEIDSVVKCIEMGAADYLNKPFNPVLLKARVNASLEKKRLQDKQRELFRKFATDEVAEELLTSGFSLNGKLVDATVLFVDIRSFNDVGEEAGDEIDLVFVGYRQDNVGAFQTRLFQNPGISPRPHHNLHFQVIADPLQSLGVDVDDHHFLFFLGQPFGEMIAHLTRANNDDFYRGNLVFIRLWFSPFPHLW